MGNRITNNGAALWSGGNDDLPVANKSLIQVEPSTVSSNSSLGTTTKLFEANNNAQLLRQQIAAKYAPTASQQRITSDADLRQRADGLSKVLTGGGKRTYEAVAPFLRGLSAADAKQLRALYQQQTGRDLLKGVDNYLFMGDRLSVFKVLAPERVHEQAEPQAMGTIGNGIKMDPPTKEVLQGAQIKYQLDLPDEIGGDRRVSHLIRSENANLEEAGASFTADYQTESNYQVTFEARYGDGLPEFYTYKIAVKNAVTKTENELNNLAGSAPDAELYGQYLDGQIGDLKQAINDLESRRDGLKNDIRNGVGNSSDKYDELRAVEKQLNSLSSILSEMTTARTEMNTAFADSVGKPIPLKAVLVARENGQTIPLQLYAKNLGDGKWAIIDLTNASKPRTWTGAGALPADALNEAWSKFVGGTNDLPAGQIAAEQPKGLGFQDNKIWNSASSGSSTLKQWSNGLGAGSIVLALLGGAAAFGPGTQPAAVPLLLGSGVLGGASAGTNLADRVNNGTFQWKSTETALDLLGIAGGIASLGGLGALTGAGRTIFANGAKFTVQNAGNFTRIGQVAANGANVAGGILIANQYVDAIDRVNRSSMSADQKATATRGILMQAAAVGGLMILGVGISTKLARVSQAKNWNEIEGLIGKNLNEVELPPGYATRQKNGRTEITRTNANETEFAPLSVSDEGVIQLGGADNRISNANTMNNNYLKALRERMTARFGAQNADKLTKEINGLVTKHHILPDNVLQRTDLGRRALIAGYDLDAGSNTIGLAKSTANQARLRTLGEATPNQPGHWTSHGEYDKAVITQLDRLKNDLELEYGKPLGEIPDTVIIKEMKNLENEFRQNIKAGQVPVKDGRIAFVPATSGQGEIRV